MASEVINALFTADENISDALDQMRNASLTTEQALDQLQNEFVKTYEQGDLLDGSLEDLQREHEATAVAVKSLQRNFQDINRVASEYRRGTMSADEATDQLRREFTDLSSSVTQADGMLGVLQRTMRDVTDSGRATTHAGAVLERQINSVGRVSQTTGLNLDALSNGMVRTSIAAKNAEDSAEDFTGSLYGTSASAYSTSAAMKLLEESTDNAKDELKKGRNSALGLAGALSVLSGAAEGTALEFGSLSVNIGPFNLALRNFLTQVPAILTGMGSILAVVTSLIVAFTTLAAVSGALVLGGALAFFEEFSAQFEEAGEAVEALGSALKDLFVSALEPVMTVGNISVFTGLINDLAELTNRFAQFAQLMRGEVLGAISQMEGDVDDFFNAMRVSFLLLEPVVIGLMNFFLNDLPPILERFAVLTRNISGDLTLMANSVGGLMNELLDFAGVILAGLAPALGVILTALTDVFILINQLPDALLAGAISGAILTLAVVKLMISLASLGSAIAGVTATMAAQAGTGAFLGVVYRTLTGAAMAYTGGSLTLYGAIKSVTLGLLSQLAAMEANAIAAIKNSLAVSVLTTAYSGLVGWLKATTTWQYISAGASKALAAAKAILSGAILGTTAFLFGEAAAAGVASAANTVLGAATTVAAGAMTLLSAAVNTTIAPLWLIIGVIALLVAGLVGLAQYLTDVNIFQPLIDGADFLISKLQDIIGLLDVIPGMGGGMGDAEMGADIDDIQTEADMNLNFEESVQNNMDIDADPEEKSQLSRVVKDAMEEANSFDRRRNGFTGN